MLLKEILLGFVDISVSYFEVFDAYNIYRKPIKQYRDWRYSNNISAKTAYELGRRGYITKKGSYYELSKKGNLKIQQYLIEDLSIPKPKVWDNIWRFVIFDIPEEKKSKREVFRKKLRRLGLESVQKSVFCYPHDCIKEISFITKSLEIERYVTYLEVSNIITGKNIFKIFQEKNIL